jgi:hypothetical protein
MPGLRVREYHGEHEEEAYGVGAAVLLPWGQFYHHLDAGRPVSEIAEAFDVTEALVQYRIKITAASNLYRSRCRAPKDSSHRPPVRAATAHVDRFQKRKGVSELSPGYGAKRFRLDG